MRSWIIKALEEGPRERAELLGIVDALANPEGFQAADISALKKALMNLKTAGLVVNMRQGWWALSTGSNVAEVENPADLSMGKRSIQVLKEIGQGAEYVYVLQFHDEVKRATSSGQDNWNCKIGRSRNAAQRLLSSVSSTYLAQSPEVGLMICCDSSVKVESAIHSALKMCGRHTKTSLGNEWFSTSPQRVAGFYVDWTKACSNFTR